MYKKLQNIFLYSVLTLIIFASSWALFRSDFFRFHDFTQGARIVEMTNALQDGHFPVIWSANLGYGYGMPLFEFYAPLPYYVGSLFYLLGFSLIHSVKIIIFISSLLTALGGYLLGKKLFGTLAGVLVSAAITLAPYRAVNLYVRGALSEAWGIMALPFILLGIIKVVQKEKGGWIILVISIFVLLVSHNLTAVIFLPFSVLFGAGFLFIQSRSSKKLYKNFFQTVVILAGCYFLAFTLSAFYILPALLEKDFTRIESTILTDYFNYKLHFVGVRQFFTENWGYGGSTYGPLDGISFYLGFGQLAGLLLSFYAALLLLKKVFIQKKKLLLDKNMLIYVLIISLLGASLLLATAKTQFIWEQIYLLSFLQFPWRYLSAATIFVGLGVGAVTVLLPNIFYKTLYTALLVLLLLFNAKYFQPEEFRSDLSEYYYSDPNKLRQEMSTTLPDYIPVQISAKEITPVALQGQVLYCQVLGDCEISFEVVKDTVNQKVVRVLLESEEQLIFSIAHFPGWSAKINDTSVPVLSSKEGYVQVLAPQGEHSITVYLDSTPIRKAAYSLSAFGLVIFLGVYFWYHKSNVRH